MVTPARHAAMGIAALPGAYLLAGWWYESMWSERIWTWLGHTFGQDFGLASDVEFLLMHATAFSVSFLGGSFLLRLILGSGDAPRQGTAGWIKEVLLATLAGILILSATFFLAGWWLPRVAGQKTPVMELWTTLGAAFLVVSLIALAGWFLWRAFMARRTRT